MSRLAPRLVSYTTRAAAPRMLSALSPGTMRTRVASSDRRNEAAVEHHAGAESGARRQHHERADTTAGTEEELAERERVDVVVDESRKPEALTEHRRQRQPAQLRDVQRLVADAARRAVDQPGHAGADSRDVESATRRLGAHDGDQLHQRLDRAATPGVMGEALLVHEHFAGGGDDASRHRRPADVDAEDHLHLSRA